MTDHRPSLLHVTTTDRLGGVCEVIRNELPYLAESGWDARWVVAGAQVEARDASLLFHNALYGVPSGPFPVGPARAGLREYVEANAETIADAARGCDVVVLHDPLALALAPAARSVARRVAWRCHVGTRRLDLVDEHAIEVLRPYLDEVDDLFFADRSFVWPGWTGDARLSIIPPGIDPRSGKNRELDPDVHAAIWGRLWTGRALPHPPGADGGTDAAIDIRDHGTGGLRHPDAPFILQVSRWDPLKGQLGVLRGFAQVARHEPDLELVLIGPNIDDRRNYSVNGRVWRSLIGARAALSEPIRRRVHLWQFGPPRRAGEDLALNVLRTQAHTVVQNSSRESFGLTVAEALWKGAVLVGSDTDGIASQIEHDVNGLLAPYTRGDGPWIDEVSRSVRDQEGRRRWSEAARESARQHLLSETSVRRQLDVFAADWAASASQGRGV
jgi:trehalose synthase